MKKNVNKIKHREGEVIEKIKQLRNVRGLPRMATRLLEGIMRSLPAVKRTPEIYLLLANLYVDIGKSSRAKAAFRTAARKARQTKNNVLLADILRKWGYLYLHTNPNIRQAQKLINESVALIKPEVRENPTKEILAVLANCYASLGNLCQTKGELVNARYAYEQAYNYAERGDAKERAVTVIGDLGSIAILEGRWKEAEALLSQARGRARRYYQHALPATLLRLGRLYASPGNPRRNPAKAESLFRESLQVAKKGGWKREQADALRALGEEEKADRIYRSIGYRAHLLK